MLAFLLTLVQEEDDEKFIAALFNNYKNQMWYKANFLLKDEHLAEDAVQIAFIGIIKNIKTARNIEKKLMRYYLLEAVKHAAIDIIRKNRKITDAEKEYGLVVSTPPDIFENLHNRKEIIYTINKLPEKYRTVLTLYLVFDVSEKDIAKELGIKINTVRQQIFRGRKMFVEIYEKENTSTNEQPIR